ncbi:MAG: hypothetical protein A3F84_20855 [Candidatus Handelsmanbacteria bacterium RIFCSPLOWO2_12_FULL_64_10]|uniref:Uncharacterized protein n=1 Tax=Handelsmanbacteria sp. (strain RIFCSPLOWO2_12_FULL_64_10) TaxID=1817868 RepID=A0A1F6D4U9_HANXR|nr:MAG: hypothetical protein A3F84_20855 [Candidatus Handelsmanbacteria bacterium RIFCSPLOWO2_12_FULL_64_10]
MKAATRLATVLLTFICISELVAQSNPDCDGVRIPASVSFDLRGSGLAASAPTPPLTAARVAANIGKPAAVVHAPAPPALPTATSVLSSMSLYTGGWTLALPPAPVPIPGMVPVVPFASSSNTAATADPGATGPATALVAYAVIPVTPSSATVAPSVAAPAVVTPSATVVEPAKAAAAAAPAAVKGVEGAVIGGAAGAGGAVKGP